MNPRRLVQESDEPEAGGGKETLEVTLPGNTLPVPRWTLSWIGVLVLIAMTGVIARHIGLDFQNGSWSEEAKKQMEFANQEYGRHLWEEPVQTYAPWTGSSWSKTYADHCIAIQRKVGASFKVKLIPDLTMESDRSARRSDVDATGSGWARRALDTLVPHLEAQGRCTTPHRESFKTWNGQKSGCQVAGVAPVARRLHALPDDEHVQRHLGHQRRRFAASHLDRVPSLRGWQRSAEVHTHVRGVLVAQHFRWTKA